MRVRAGEAPASSPQERRQNPPAAPPGQAARMLPLVALPDFCPSPLSSSFARNRALPAKSLGAASLSAQQRGLDLVLQAKSFSASVSL